MKVELRETHQDDDWIYYDRYVDDVFYCKSLRSKGIPYPMAYSDYHGPNKADKGKEGGSCNRTLCQAPGAIWYNHGSYAWYCKDCRRQIEFDRLNKAHWDRDFLPKLGHPQFETRQMMNERQADENAA